MSRPRLSVGGLMALVAYVGFGVAALHNADPFWASASFTIAIGAVSIAPVGALGDRQILFYLRTFGIWLDDNVVLRQCR